MRWQSSCTIIFSLFRLVLKWHLLFHNWFINNWYQPRHLQNSSQTPGMSLVSWQCNYLSIIKELVFQDSSSTEWADCFTLSWESKQWRLKYFSVLPCLNCLEPYSKYIENPQCLLWLVCAFYNDHLLVFTASSCMMEPLLLTLLLW